MTRLKLDCVDGKRQRWREGLWWGTAHTYADPRVGLTTLLRLFRCLRLLFLLLRIPLQRIPLLRIPLLRIPLLLLPLRGFRV